MTKQNSKRSGKQFIVFNQTKHWAAHSRRVLNLNHKWRRHGLIAKVGATWHPIYYSGTRYIIDITATINGVQQGKI